MDYDYDCDSGYDHYLPSLSRSSSTSSLYQLEQSHLRGAPCMTTTTTVSTSTMTTTTTTTTTSSTPTTPTPSEITPPIAAVPVEEWVIEDSRDHYPQEYQEEESYMLLPSFGLVSDGPYLFVFDFSVSLYYPIRATILFLLGFAFSVVVDHLLTQHDMIIYPSNIPRLWDTASWLPPTCGFSAILVGTLYPLVDNLWGGHRAEQGTHDLSSVIRCFGGFIGLNYASSKLPWANGMQATLGVALISIGLWLWFDRTSQGFLIASIVALIGSLVVFTLALHGWYSFTQANFFGVASWIPCILFSSSVCFGTIGRQLDVIPSNWHSFESMLCNTKSE